MTDTAHVRRRPRSCTGSSSASPAIPATACSSPATGSRSASALFGNDLSTLPEFPAEIRAPAGTLAGVSAFQVHISDHDITTPGDASDVLVAMNPAALKADLDRLEPGGTLIVNADTFDERNLAKAGYAENPLTDGSLKGYTVYEVPMTSLTKEAATPLGVKPRDADRSKNFFALGLISWMYTRPVEPTLEWIEERFAKNEQVLDVEPGRVQGRLQLRRDGRAVRPPLSGEAGEARRRRRTRTSPATPRWRGAWSRPASWPSCRCSSGQLPDHAGVRHPPRAVEAQELRRPHLPGRRRDRRPSAPRSAPPSAAISASPPRAVPASRLKAETISLAVSLELPLLIIDIQRGGPSTGLPTKTEAGRPAHGHVRPPRRGAAADRRRRTARRTASTPPSRRPASRSSTARR